MVIPWTAKMTNKWQIKSKLSLEAKTTKLILSYFGPIITGIKHWWKICSALPNFMWPPNAAGILLLFGPSLGLTVRKEAMPSHRMRLL